ncbi:uncharacterized protein LOC143285748 isoform X2 [Babylonia areolata]|uniref:uncharacterized protein LOC143285748 isoform X2 n=1 Tax=Babylonia areolata TaxID=304850 RepID=UPI003FCFB223
MSDSTSSSGPDNTQKALITLAVLGGCILIALVVAKLVDYCYDHHVAINDDASDISEHTRNLIRSRLTVAAFRGKRKAQVDATATNGGQEISAKQRKIIRIWSAKAKESRRIAEQRRAQDQAKAMAARAELIIRVEEATGPAKQQTSQVSQASASLAFVSETSDKGAGPSTAKNSQETPTEAGSSRAKTPQSARPEVKRTLSGVDSSRKITEAPVAVVAVSASGNRSVSPAKGGGGSTKSSQKEQTLPAREGSVVAKGEQAAVHKSGSNQSAKSPRASATPVRPVSKSQSFRSPTPKGKSIEAYQAKSEDVNSPKIPLTRSPSPVKQTAQNSTASSTTKPSTDTAKTEQPSQKNNSQDNLNPAKTGAKQGAVSETPNRKDQNSPGGDNKRDSSPSPTRAAQSRPHSSLSNMFFTAVRPTNHPTPPKSPNRSPSPTKSPDQNPDPKAADASPVNKAAGAKVRPKSFHAKESERLTHLPKKLASSVALYGRATNDLDKHKAQISKKKAAASPSRSAIQSPAPGPAKKMEQSPIVVAAAARKARIKSAKP